MARFKRILMPACLILTLVLVISPSVAFSAETQYPAGVTAAKECTVEVMAWVDGRVIGWGWNFEARGPFGLGSGFFANEDGDVFTAAHCVNMSEEEMASAAIMYFLGGIWFEDEWYEKVDFGSFYTYYYASTWWAWVEGELTVTAEEVDYVYRAGDGEPHVVEDILFYEDPETGMDIAILETGLSNTPYIPLKEAPPLEGSRAYVIGYAGIDLTLEFWQAMDAIMADPYQRPDSFAELMGQAADVMVEGLRREGPSIETGLLGSSTRIYEMDARRFHGTSWSGLSGGPVVDELGNCIGLLPWGIGDSRGYFIPAQHLEGASQRAGIDIFPALEIGAVVVEPAFVEAGQSFDVRVEVSNLGFVEGDYTVTLKLEDGTEASQRLTIDEGDTETLVLSAVKESPGFSTGSLEIGRTSVEVVVNPVEFSNLTIQPALAAPGDDIRVQAEASNLSEEMSILVTSLSIDGEVEATKTLTLEGGATETVTFVVNRDTAGTYEVAVGNLSQQFTLESEFPLTLMYIAIAGLLGLAGVVLGALAFVRSRG
ncbi:hypothetical protein ES703_29510 [subsurface metagenome]